MNIENTLYPLILEPIILEKPWGAESGAGQWLPGVDRSAKVGEAWLVTEGDPTSKIMNGPLRKAPT